jgi:carboxyl-terminal processing protease
MRTFRSLSAAVVVVACCALVGGMFGPADTVAAQDQLPEQLKVFGAAVTAIETHYAGPLETDRLVYGAITGMLQTLDPHSSFMDPKSYKQMRERQEGRYYGLGISIGASEGDITVANVFEGSPAYQSGLRRGDVIARIEGQDTKGWTTEDAVGRLRGNRGTRVSISIRRTGYDRLIDLQVMRDEIRMPTVPAAFMLDASTAYIKITDFGENTDQELGRALKELGSKGMQRLVLDLRGNPGGALDQAIRVANRFLPKGDLIVYTKGRVQNSENSYRASEASDYLNIPLVTLVNRNSASASEIVSGALQDHDRSLIVGETTFGKALVQSVFRVNSTSGAAITTARYYTPSGRLIQRPWDGSYDDYLTYTMRDQDANKTHRKEDLKYTDSGRTVYSGGGVEPDRRFDGPVMGFSPSRFARTLANPSRNLFGMFAERFARRGDKRITATPARPVRELAPDFQVTDELVAEFKKFVQESRLVIDEAAWAKDQAFIRTMLRFEIDLDLFGVGTAWQNFVRQDPQLQFALGLFPEAQSLLEKSRQNGIRRAQR